MINNDDIEAFYEFYHNNNRSLRVRAILRSLYEGRLSPEKAEYQLLEEFMRK
jgi:hypothetical protein